MKTVQIKRPVSLEIATVLLETIRLNCIDLFDIPEFKKSFTELKDCVYDQYNISDNEVVDSYMVYEQVLPEE